MSKRTKKFVSIILMIMMLCCVPQARIMAEEEGDQTNIDDVTEVAPDNSTDDAVDNAVQEPEAEETMIGMKLMNTKNAVLLGDANDASEKPSYVVTVEIPSAGYTVKTPRVKEKNNLLDIGTSYWTATIENAKKEQARFATDDDSITFDWVADTEIAQAGKTYYGVAMVDFDADDKASINRVSIETTEYIKEVGSAMVNESRNSVVLLFSVTIPAIKVNVIFGDKHQAFAEKAASLFENTEATVTGTTLSYYAQKGSDCHDALIPINDAISDMSERRSGDEEVYIPYLFNLKPIDQYSSFEDYLADYNELDDREDQNEDLTVYISWLKPTDLVVDIKPLICGTEVTYINENQSPKPQITLVDGQAELNENYLGWTDKRGMEPFQGVAEGGEAYFALCGMFPKFGYYIKSASSNTGTVVSDERYLAEGMILISVEAEHDWESQEIIEPSIEGANGKEAVKCRHDKTSKGDSEFRYFVESGKGSTWTKGSSSDLPFVFKRSVDDEGTYDVFFEEGGIVKVDDKEISSDKYEAEKGSLKLSLKKDYLETLSEGSHKVTVVFNDEVLDKGSSYISANFTILKKSDGGSNSGSSSTVKYHAPKTGIE